MKGNTFRAKLFLTCLTANVIAVQQISTRNLPKLLYSPDGFQFMPQAIGKMSTPASGDEPDRAVKPGRVLPDPPSFPGNLSTTHPPLPDLKQPLAKPQKRLTKKVNVQYTDN